MAFHEDLLSPRRRTSLVPLLVLAGVVLVGGAFALGRLSAPGALPALFEPVPSPGTVAGAEGPGEPAEPSGEPAVAAAPVPAPQAAAPAAQAVGGVRHLEVALAGTLDASVSGAVGPEIGAPLTQVTSRLLVWWLDVSRDARPADEIEILYELPDGKEPLVHALRYRSQKLAKELRAYRWQVPGSTFARYYDEKGAELELRLKDSPIDSYEQVTSLLRDGRRHRGVDFKTPVGTPVLMPGDAVVVRKNWNFRGNGNCIELEEPNGRRILFLHLSEVAKGLGPGSRVKKGQQVALSGNTGRSTAPHLHYQLESANGRILDPFDVHETWHAQLPAEHQPGFAAEVARLDKLLSGEGTLASTAD